MKQPEIRSYLFDIIQACELLQQFTQGKTLPDYKAEPMLRSAVERQFEIVGEALASALRVEPSLTERITDSALIVAFRNRLIHGYATVADEVVWGVLEGNLPTLHSETTALLDEVENA